MHDLKASIGLIQRVVERLTPHRITTTFNIPNLFSTSGATSGYTASGACKKEMEINWLRALGAGFDLALTIAVCAFVGYYLGGGRLNQVTPFSILGLAVGALVGLFIAIYSLIRTFGATGGKR